MATVPTLDQALSPSIAQPSLLDKLDVIPGLLNLMGTAVYTALSGPFRGEAGAYTLKQHVNHAVVRQMVRRFNTLQLQYLGGPFSKIYQKWCKETGHKPETVKLKSGCTASWIGDYKTAKYVCVYYHGGGFSLDADDTYIQYWNSVQDDLKTSNLPVAFLFLEYTLVPHATYPTQIIQAVEALQYVLTDLKRPASEVLLGGDSAGGNMCLAVLSHLMHPSPELPELKLVDGDKLKAIVLVAPWVSFNLDWPSEERNRYKDIVSSYAGGKWSNDYMAGKAASPYSEALLAPADWWKDSKVEQMLCVCGADEILVDAISKWVEKYKSVNPDGTTFVIGKNECHIAPIINLKFGDTSETQQGQAITAFLKAKL